MTEKKTHQAKSSLISLGKKVTSRKKYTLSDNNMFREEVSSVTFNVVQACS